MAAATLRESIDRTVRQHRHALRQSAALGIQSALHELREVWDDCRVPGWDGYGAAPVEEAAFDMAYNLLDSLPFGFPLPSIGAQANGQLTLEWYRTPTRNFSISIDPDGLIHYAGLFGPEQHHGTVPFYDGLPEKILRLAGEV